MRITDLMKRRCLLSRKSHSDPPPPRPFFPDNASKFIQSSCSSCSLPSEPSGSTLSSVILRIIYLNLLFTFFTFRFRLFVFSITRIGSLSTLTTSALHEKNRSSIQGSPLNVNSLDPSMLARFSRRTVPGGAFGMWKGRRSISPSVRRYGRAWMWALM